MQFLRNFPEKSSIFSSFKKKKTKEKLYKPVPIELQTSLSNLQESDKFTTALAAGG